jgi:hypothetical protein
VSIIGSCRKDLRQPQWDVDLLAPILKSDLDFGNLLADSLLQSNPDNSLTLVYNNNFYGLTLDSLVNIPDTTVANKYWLLGWSDFNPGDVIVSNLGQSTQYNISNVELTHATIRSGSVVMQIKSYVREKIVLTYQIPIATLNSVPFSVTVTIPARVGNNPGVVNISYPLSGYDMDLRGPQLNSYNTIYTSMSAKVDPNAPDTVRVFSTDTISISNAFTGIVPQYARGYFGQGTYNSSDTSSFGMFNHIVGGTLKLDSANIKLKIENSVGVDARVKINNLTSINSRTGNSVSLNHPVIGSPVNITRAFDNNGTVTPTLYSVQLDNTNSNIKQLLENLPDKIGYSVDADINPLGNVSGGNDFIYYGSGLRVNMDMQVPLWFASDHLALVDTLDYSIATDNQNINSGTLSLFADNGFPFEASIQLYILNGNNAIVDSLMPVINTIDEGVVDGNYIVVQPRTTRIEIPLSADKMSTLYNNHKIYVKTKLNTYGYPNYVKIYNYYKISLKLVGDIEYHVAPH